MESLINKEQYRKYRLALFLEKNKTRILTQKFLCRELFFSEYILKATIEELNEDFNYLHLDFLIQQDVSGNTIRLTGKDDHISSVLLNYYFQTLLGVEILLEILKGEMCSLKKFSKNKFISSSVAYRWIQMLETFLARQNLTLLKQNAVYHVKGEWRKKCLLEVELCSRTGADPQSYFSQEVYHTTKKLIEVIYPEEKAIPHSLERKLAFFVSILIRDNFKGLTGDYQVFFDGYHITELVWSHQAKDILSNMDITETDKDFILDQIIMYLIFLGMLPPEDQNCILRGTIARKMTEEAIEAFWNSTQYSDISNFDNMLITNLDWVHFSAIYEAAVPILVKERDWSYFETNHPELLSYYHERMILLVQNENSLLRPYSDRLVGHYLLLLNKYGFENAEDEVCITIDFSEGYQFNEYVSNMISQMETPCRIVVTQELSEDTDILLTDELMVDSECMEIIRLSLGSAQFSWLTLKNRLSDCINRTLDKKYISV